MSVFWRALRTVAVDFESFGVILLLWWMIEAVTDWEGTWEMLRLWLAVKLSRELDINLDKVLFLRSS